jgi:hypothetical protein
LGIPFYFLNDLSAAIHLQNVYIKHERRLRLIFDVPLAAGAFTNTALYTVTNLDGKGTSPTVVAVFAITGGLQQIEVSLGADLVDGAQYQVAAVGVPGTNGGTTKASSVLPFTVSANLANTPNQEVTFVDLGLLLYGRDLLWNGQDLQEDASGDLSTIQGTQNVQQAIWRRELSEGLMWDTSYGARPRQYIDGSSLETLTLQGAINRQALADPRVKSVNTQILPDTTETRVVFGVNVTLIGNEVPQQIDLTVQTT